MDLSSMVMLKVRRLHSTLPSLSAHGVDVVRVVRERCLRVQDNHVWHTGSIDACTRKAKAVAGHATKVEVR